MRRALTTGIAFIAGAMALPLATRADSYNTVYNYLNDPSLNYTVIDLGNGTTLGQNSGPVAGNELLGNGVKAAFSGGGNGQITGTLYYDNTVTGTNTFSQLQNAPKTVQVSTSVTQAALNAAQTLSNYAASLPATQTFGQINGSQSITGNGGLNVIDVSSLSNPTLTLNGNSSDLFVFNVSGLYQTNQKMILNGVDPGKILFNFTGSSGHVFETSGGDLSYGVYLATDGGQFQFSNLNLTGKLINTAGDVQLVSGSKIPTAVPLSPTIYGAATLMACMLGLGKWRRMTA